MAEISKELQLGEEGDVYETVLQQRLESTLKRTVNRLTDWSQKSKSTRAIWKRALAVTAVPVTGRR